jgi:hypothetical protein
MGIVLDRLTRKLGLLQSASRDSAQRWARRTRELLAQKQSADQAAIKAAKEIFDAEFVPTRYKYQNDEIEQLLSDIDGL